MGKGKKNGGITVKRRKIMKVTIEFPYTGEKIETDTDTIEKLAKELKNRAVRKRIFEKMEKKEVKKNNI